MIAVLRADPASAGLLRFGDGQVHGRHAGHLADSVSRLEQRRGFSLGDQERICPGPEAAGAQSVRVNLQANHAVRIDAAKVGEDQVFRRELGLNGGKPELLKTGDAESPQRLGADLGFVHLLNLKFIRSQSCTT